MGSDENIKIQKAIEVGKEARSMRSVFLKVIAVSLKIGRAHV